MKKLIHGGDVYRNPDCIDFSANINPLGPPDSVKKAVAACVNDIAHYPDVQCKELKKRLGWAERMEEEALIIGNGAAELIFALGYSLRPRRSCRNRHLQNMSRRFWQQAVKFSITHYQKKMDSGSQKTFCRC